MTGCQIAKKAHRCMAQSVLCVGKDNKRCVHCASLLPLTQVSQSVRHTPRKLQSRLSNITTCFRVGSVRIPEVLFDAAAPGEIHFADNLEKGKGGFEGLFRVSAGKFYSPAMYNFVSFPK